MGFQQVAHPRDQGSGVLGHQGVRQEDRQRREAGDGLEKKSGMGMVFEGVSVSGLVEGNSRLARVLTSVNTERMCEAPRSHSWRKKVVLLFSAVEQRLPHEMQSLVTKGETTSQKPCMRQVECLLSILLYGRGSTPKRLAGTNIQAQSRGPRKKERRKMSTSKSKVP